MDTMIYSDWAKHASENAVSIAEEARILLNANKKERAYYLSHLATEEAAKSILLKAMDLLSTPLSELSKVNKLLRNHQKKIDFLIQFSQAESPELSEEISGVGKELITHINNLKNNSMYVTHINGSICRPKDTIATLDVEKFVSYGEALARYSSVLLKSK